MGRDSKWQNYWSIVTLNSKTLTHQLGGGRGGDKRFGNGDREANQTRGARRG